MQDKEIRLVVTDLDGTLLNPEREISQAAVDIIAEIRKKGVAFTFITGRPPYAVERFARRTGIAGPIAGCNGAVVFEGESLLVTHSFPVEPLKKPMEEAAAAGMTVLLYTGGTEYCLRETAWTRSRSMPLWEPGRKIRTAEKVNILAGKETEAFDRLLPRINALAGRYSIAVYGLTGCEIVAGGVNKATGLAELCRLYGVSREQALAIGDNENDNPMLKAAGIGAAVANAAESTKWAADYVCGAGYTDGVVEAIRRFVLGEETNGDRNIHQYSV